MKRLTFILVSCFILVGCSNIPPKPAAINKLKSFSLPKLPSLNLYKPSIIQGSDLDIKEVNKLQLGMSKEIVISIIGSPSIIDPFHQYQWDYINHSTINNGEELRYRLRLEFKDDFLSEIDKSGLEDLLSIN